MTISVVTLGCKVNQCESASIVSTLRSYNFTVFEYLTSADIYVLNTCSVTSEADKKSRQYITKMQKLNPTCGIIVVGCSSQNDQNKFNKENVIAIGGTHNKSKFVLDTINQYSYSYRYSIISDRVLYHDVSFASNGEYCYEKYPQSGKTRAFIKIQDGCNRYCTYCIIPYLRGKSCSRSIDDVLTECNSIKSKEIVLTGIDLSSYGRDIGVTIVDLLQALSKITARKRLGSLECEIIDTSLLKVMKDGEYCPHFHLSLQSGCDAVLKSMNRRYSCDYFYDKVSHIRDFFPMAGITTDIIVGFPTETEENFVKSCEFIEYCKFSDIHVFPYSARKGTLAYKKYSELPPNIINNRVDKLLEIKQKMHNEFLSLNSGSVAKVYFEDREGSYNVGYTPNYIKVYSDAPCGELVDLRLTDIYKNGLIGVLDNK